MNINGAPINDVTTPIGTSMGEAIVLDMVSEKERKIPPSKILPIRLYLCFEPVRILAAWGIIKPTKPIIPVFDTITDITKDPAK